MGLGSCMWCWWRMLDSRGGGEVELGLRPGPREGLCPLDPHQGWALDAVYWVWGNGGQPWRFNVRVGPLSPQTQ